MAEQRGVLITTEAWIAKLESAAPPILKGGGPSGTSTAMEERVAKLETHFEYVRKDLDEIKATLGTISDNLVAIKSDVGDAKTEASLVRAHTAGKVTVITTGIGAVLAILGVLLAVLAFGGDRFNGGLDATSIARQAAADALAEK